MHSFLANDSNVFIDTEELLVSIAAWRAADYDDKSVELGVALKLLDFSVKAIRQLQDRLDTEHQKRVNAEERIDSLLQEMKEDGIHSEY